MRINQVKSEYLRISEYWMRLDEIKRDSYKTRQELVQIR